MHCSPKGAKLIKFQCTQDHLSHCIVSSSFGMQTPCKVLKCEMQMLVKICQIKLDVFDSYSLPPTRIWTECRSFDLSNGSSHERIPHQMCLCD